MTVTYADSSFLRLLFRWRGSIWKSIWKELVIYLMAYFTINASYRLAMTKSQRADFEAVVHFVSKWTVFIPLQFLLSFFVSYIVNQWWDQLMSIGWPDKFLLLLTANLPGMDHETIMIRRTIARWTMLNAVLVWKEISRKVKKRFPSDDHVFRAGLFTEAEYKLYQNTSGLHGRWFTPVSWIVNRLTKLKQKGIITEFALQNLVNELYTFRSAHGMLTIYDWVNAPLRYTQVATFATYGYFALCLIGRQTVIREFHDSEFDIYFPIGTILEFIFYVGWLKVAEEYRVPFGEDDDDFDMNYILDRDIHVAFMLVDELAGQQPVECEDVFFSNKFPTLPHTKASIGVRDRIPKWRLQKYTVDDKNADFLEKKMIEKNIDVTLVDRIMNTTPLKFIPRRSKALQRQQQHDHESKNVPLSRRGSEPTDLLLNSDELPEIRIEPASSELLNFSPTSNSGNSIYQTARS